MHDGALRRIAARLERGAPAWDPLSRLGARLWASVVKVPRRLRIPPGTRVLCVGGATLGGSGKTPLAIACTSHLVGLGLRAIYVGHAFGVRTPPRARVVSAGDDVRAVGDEALEAAARLGEGRVVVGPTRQAAVDFAAARAEVLVLDGPLQLAPSRAHLALLAVDREAPLGSGACPPRGDLRAPWRALRSHADVVVAVGDRLAPWDRGPFAGALEATLDACTVHLRGVSRPLEGLRNLRVGLATAAARPDRLLRVLARRGIQPVTTLHAADHATLGLPRRSNLDLWLVPAKCAAAARGRDDVGVLEYHIDLPAELALRLAGTFWSDVSEPREPVVSFPVHGSRSRAHPPS